MATLSYSSSFICGNNLVSTPLNHPGLVRRRRRHRRKIAVSASALENVVSRLQQTLQPGEMLTLVEQQFTAASRLFTSGELLDSVTTENAVSWLQQASQPTIKLVEQQFSTVSSFLTTVDTSQSVVSIYAVWVASFLVAVTGALGLRQGTSAAAAGDAELPSRYDPDAIALYFTKRPLNVLQRSLTVTVKCSALVCSIISDKLLGTDKQNERLRAAQLVQLITDLGPTTIKIGQALSIRPDILSVVYLEELQKLQDRVPPFSNDEAQRTILEGLGQPATELFTDVSQEPIAAASLGQVYKGRLRKTGAAVAIKVQRPDLLEGISRDLFLMRVTAQLLQGIPNVHTDLVALLDSWAFRFFDELDYIQEGRNAQRFQQNMRTMKNIVVPKVYMEYTSRKVLTTEWIEGERLSESKAADRIQLVTVALNCYLMQLQENGFLHADPHPGNLLRTPDGRLCILDYGLMTEVTDDVRYAFTEYILHLLSSDYGKVANDLVALGFVPPELVDPEKTAAVVPQLTRVLGELVQGGGARKINFTQITQDLAQMSQDYVFVIPPYFALILRAFSVLEGIGLDANPDYVILEECYPYVSKRLLTDDSPRARQALKDFLYAGKDQLDVERVEQIVAGFRAFRKDMAPVTQEKSSRTLDPATKDALLLMFSPEGSFIQEIMLTELVRAVDALSRSAFAELWRYMSRRLPLPPALAIPGSWPLPLPSFFLGITLGITPPLATLSAEDERSLEMIRRVWTLLEPERTSPSELRGLIPILGDLYPGATTIAQRFLLMLLQRQALRLADDLDGKNSVSQWNKDPVAVTRRLKFLRF